jgi:hypothetical protein
MHLIGNNTQKLDSLKVRKYIYSLRDTLEPDTIK